MAYNYIDTPRTEAGDRTQLTAANISFSDVQGFPSPSKDPGNNLMGQLRSRAGGQAYKTPRSRNALAHLRNGKAKNEFTPLLKSAAVNRFKTDVNSPRKHSGGKENGTNELVNSMMASTYDAPQTPAYLKVGYKDASRTPGLPMDSSVVEGDSRSSFVATRTPGPLPAVSSSTLMSTPIPELPSKGAQGRGEQGNVLTLREQEAKLTKLDKENFNLKLKIHFLDEALKRTGTDYQQGMIKENAELKIDKTTLTYEIKQQQKSLLRAEKELEEYRQQLRDYAEKVKRRHTDEMVKEELERLRQSAEKSRQLAQDREEEIDELRKRLDLAEQGSDEKLQNMKDDIADLEQEVRSKEQELDGKDEEIEALQEKLKSSSNHDEEVEALQKDISELEAELEEKDAAIVSRDEELVELRSQIRNSSDREKSTRKLRGDVDQLESEIREKNEVIDEKHEELRALQKRLQSLESQSALDLAAKSAELRDQERLLEDREGEIKALKERLSTARGSWDAEAQQTDARLQEKDALIQERDSQLREKARALDEKVEEASQLRARLATSESSSKNVVEQQEKQSVQKNVQIFELQEKLRIANTELDFHIDKKNAELSKLREEFKIAETEKSRLQERLNSRGSPTKKDAVINDQASRLAVLESKLKTVVDENEAEIEELERQLSTAEKQVELLQVQVKNVSPSRDSRSRMTELETALRQLQEEKESQGDEIIVLESSLEEVQAERNALKTVIAGLQSNLAAAQAPPSSTPVRERDELRLRVRLIEKQCEDYKQQVELLDAELDKAWTSKSVSAIPTRERNELRSKLSDAEDKIQLLEEQLIDTRREVQEHAPTSGRRDLHNMLRDAQVQIENLQEQLEMARGQQKHPEQGPGEESELRKGLRKAKAEIENLNRQVQQRDDRLQAGIRKEQQLRDRLKQTRQTSDETSFLGHELQDQLIDVEREVKTLQTQLKEREKTLQTSLRREAELKMKLKTMRADVRTTSSADKELENQSKTHEKELRGLSKQIQFLSAKCARESSFRRDLAFVKRWFVLQVEMYGACNKADIKMLKDMGISPDMAVRQRRPSLKAAGLAVIASLRMQKMQRAWAGNQKLHQSLLKKLEGMKSGAC